jgi:RNA-binding protein 25
VISEIAQFRERAAKREREKMRDVQASIPTLLPNGPKSREWGKPQSPSASNPKGFAKGPQSYSKPPGFVKGEDAQPEKGHGPAGKTDEELEADRKEARRRDEENSFKDVSPLGL